MIGFLISTTVVESIARDLVVTLIVKSAFKGYEHLLNDVLDHLTGGLIGKGFRIKLNANLLSSTYGLPIEELIDKFFPSGKSMICIPLSILRFCFDTETASGLVLVTPELTILHSQKASGNNSAVSIHNCSENLVFWNDYNSDDPTQEALKKKIEDYMDSISYFLGFYIGCVHLKSFLEARIYLEILKMLSAIISMLKGMNEEGRIVDRSDSSINSSSGNPKPSGGTKGLGSPGNSSSVTQKPLYEVGGLNSASNSSLDHSAQGYSRSNSDFVPKTGGIESPDYHSNLGTAFEDYGQDLNSAMSSSSSNPIFIDAGFSDGYLGSNPCLDNVLEIDVLRLITILVWIELIIELSQDLDSSFSSSQEFYYLTFIKESFLNYLSGIGIEWVNSYSAMKDQNLYSDYDPDFSNGINDNSGCEPLVSTHTQLMEYEIPETKFQPQDYIQETPL